MELMIIIFILAYMISYLIDIENYKDEIHRELCKNAKCKRCKQMSKN